MKSNTFTRQSNTLIDNLIHSHPNKVARGPVDVNLRTLYSMCAKVTHKYKELDLCLYMFLNLKNIPEFGNSFCEFYSMNTVINAYHS